jgi:hypothetical protein
MVGHRSGRRVVEFFTTGQLGKIAPGDDLASETIRELGIEPVVIDILIRSADDRIRLARGCCARTRGASL